MKFPFYEIHVFWKIEFIWSFHYFFNVWKTKIFGNLHWILQFLEISSLFLRNWNFEYFSQTCFKGVLSPGRHVRTRLYFTSESHIHSLLTLLRYGGLCDPNDEQWDRALDYISRVSELNYMTQIVIMLYEDPTKLADSDERFHIELHFSPGAKSHKDDSNFPAGGGFRPASKPNSRDVSRSNFLHRGVLCSSLCLIGGFCI